MGVAEFYRGPSGKIMPGLTMNLDEAVKRLKDLFPQTQVSLAYLFGSFTRNEAGEFSDLDLAVLLATKKDELYSAYMDLMLEVQKALATERLDLLLLNSATPSEKFEIIRSGELLYARNEKEINDFEMDVIRRYQDTAYLRAIQNDYLKKRAQAWYSEKKT